MDIFSVLNSYSSKNMRHARCTGGGCVENESSYVEMGMGRGGVAFLNVIKGEGQQVAVGTAVVCVAGLLLGKVWFAAIEYKKPSTMTPQWAAATVKYRAAQNQDPITHK